MKYSRDYHDYVFKNGKFIGKFNEMYKYSKVIPWHQDKIAYAAFSHIDMIILKQYKYDTICDIGCGLGYFTQRLYKELQSNNNTPPRITALDISQTAIDSAQKRFAKINFIRSDILKESPPSNMLFDLVVVRGVFWYAVFKYKQFFENVVNLVKKGGFLYISQPFPEENKWVGQEIIDSPEILLQILLKYVKPSHYCVKRDTKIHKNGYLYFLGKK